MKAHLDQVGLWASLWGTVLIMVWRQEDTSTVGGAIPCAGDPDWYKKGEMELSSCMHVFIALFFFLLWMSWDQLPQSPAAMLPVRMIVYLALELCESKTQQSGKPPFASNV